MNEWSKRIFLPNTTYNVPNSTGVLNEKIWNDIMNLQKKRE